MLFKRDQAATGGERGFALERSGEQIAWSHLCSMNWLLDRPPAPRSTPAPRSAAPRRYPPWPPTQAPRRVSNRRVSLVSNKLAGVKKRQGTCHICMFAHRRPHVQRPISAAAAGIHLDLSHLATSRLAQPGRNSLALEADKQSKGRMRRAAAGLVVGAGAVHMAARVPWFALAHMLRWPSAATLVARQ